MSKKWVKGIDFEPLRRQEARKIYQETGTLDETSKRLHRGFPSIKRWIEDLIPSNEELKEEARRVYLETGNVIETARILKKRVPTVRVWVKDLIPEYRKRPAPRYNPLIITNKMKIYRRQRDVTHLFKMHPRDFLLLTTDEGGHIQSLRDTALSLKEYNEYESDYPVENDIYLNIKLNKDGTVGKVMDHEGRHRSAAVWNADEDEVEVSIRFYNYKWIPINPSKMPKKLIHQMAKTWRGLKARTVMMKDVKVTKFRARRNPAVSKLEVLRSEFCEAAQSVYDGWHQDETGYSNTHDHYGGICGEIAEAIREVLEDNGISSTSFSPSIGYVHVWAVADINGEAYRVDIIPYLYEQGGGYTWRKIPDIEFEDHNIIIESMGYPFSDYLED